MFALARTAHRAEHSLIEATTRREMLGLLPKSLPKPTLFFIFFHGIRGFLKFGNSCQVGHMPSRLAQDGCKASSIYTCYTFLNRILLMVPIYSIDSVSTMWFLTISYIPLISC